MELLAASRVGHAFRVRDEPRPRVAARERFVGREAPHARDPVREEEELHHEHADGQLRL